jgi:hypothetical protein
LDALSRFLRHFDPEMTRRYVTDVLPGMLLRMGEEVEARIALANEMEAKGCGFEGEAQALRESVSVAKDALQNMIEVQGEFKAVKSEAIVDRMLQMEDGTECPIGRGAATLRQELDKIIEGIRNRVRIGARNGPPTEEREALVKSLRRFAATRNVEPHPGRHAHCGWSPERKDSLADAVCLKNKAIELGCVVADTRPDYAYSATADCLKCLFGIAFSENQRVIEERTAAVAMAAAKASSAEARAAAALQLDEIITSVAVAKEAVRRAGR